MSSSVSKPALRRSATISRPVVQLNLSYDGILDVHTSLADLLGRKAVAKKLWPHKDIGSATRYLSDCLNRNRGHELGVERSHLLKRLGAEEGLHFAFEWEAIDLGYAAPSYVETDPEKAAIRKELGAMERRAAELRQQLNERRSVPR